MSRISLKWGKLPLKVGFLLLLLLPDRDQTCVRWEQSLNHQRAREVPKLPLQVLSLLSLEEFSKKAGWPLFYFWPGHASCGVLVPLQGTEPRPPTVEVQSPNYWTAREFPGWLLDDQSNVEGIERSLTCFPSTVTLLRFWGNFSAHQFSLAVLKILSF